MSSAQEAFAGSWVKWPPESFRARDASDRRIRQTTMGTPGQLPTPVVAPAESRSFPASHSYQERRRKSTPSPNPVHERACAPWCSEPGRGALPCPLRVRVAAPDRGTGLRSPHARPLLINSRAHDAAGDRWAVGSRFLENMTAVVRSLAGSVCGINTLSTPDGTPDARIRFPMRIGEVTRGKI